MAEPSDTAKSNAAKSNAAKPNAASSGTLFGDIDRALVLVSLAQKLRRAGIPVPMSATVRATAAIQHIGPMSLDELYWVSRLCFVADKSQLTVFDALFDAVFDTDYRNQDRLPKRAVTTSAPRPGDEQHSVRLSADGGDPTDGGGVPWATLPQLSGDANEGDEGDLAIEQRMPSVGQIDDQRPFDLMDEQELIRIGELIESSLTSWPTRRSRRRRQANNGDKPQLRAALRRSLRTGGEPLVLPTTSRIGRPRPIAVMVDLSGSMEPYARAYLHVARPLAIVGKAEVFAFATTATRITPSLRLRSPVEAIERASSDVGDRFGGTRLANSFRTVLKHRSWASMLRGAVVLVVSDGWDTDPPEDLDRYLARVDRLAYKIVWVNPRQSADQFEPTVASMAAALPYCDHFLPGHSLHAMDDVISAIQASR